MARNSRLRCENKPARWICELYKGLFRVKGKKTVDLILPDVPLGHEHGRRWRRGADRWGPSAREREGRGPAAREEGEKGARRGPGWPRSGPEWLGRSLRGGGSDWARGWLGLSQVFPRGFSPFSFYFFSILFSKAFF